MAKFFLKYGCMGSGKSRDLIRAKYNYIERGMDVLTYKPFVDNRNGSNECKIVSRTDEKTNAEWILPSDNIFLLVHREIERNNQHIKAIFIDEVQFLTIKQINELSDITIKMDIPVIAYGLKSDFQANLFPAIAKTIALCDNIEEIKSICWCGKKATQNARIYNDQIIKEGNQIEIGGNEKYIALCTKHYKMGKIKK